MLTHCSATGMAFGRVGGRELVAEFDGGRVTSDAGALLLGVTDRAIRLVDRFAACFRDGRHPAFVTHRVRSLVGQRTTPCSACCWAGSSRRMPRPRRWLARARSTG